MVVALLARIEDLAVLWGEGRVCCVVSGARCVVWCGVKITQGARLRHPAYSGVC